MNDVMSGKVVETHKELVKKSLTTDDTDLKTKLLPRINTDCRGSEIEKVRPGHGKTDNTRYDGFDS
jgi:hypothetical protein